MRYVVLSLLISFSFIGNAADSDLRIRIENEIINPCYLSVWDAISKAAGVTVDASEQDILTIMKLMTGKSLGRIRTRMESRLLELEDEIREMMFEIVPEECEKEPWDKVLNVDLGELRDNGKEGFLPSTIHSGEHVQRHSSTPSYT